MYTRRYDAPVPLDLSVLWVGLGWVVEARGVERHTRCVLGEWEGPIGTVFATRMKISTLLSPYAANCKMNQFCAVCESQNVTLRLLKVLGIGGAEFRPGVKKTCKRTVLRELPDNFPGNQPSGNIFDLATKSPNGP